MATPDYARDKNGLPLYMDNVGTEWLEIIGGNIVDSAKHVYTYDSAKDELFNDALPPNSVKQQPPIGLRVRRHIPMAMTLMSTFTTEV
jgi:hypothetical protein